MYPMVCLMKKDCKNLEWTDEHQRCLDIIKERLVKACLDGYTLLNDVSGDTDLVVWCFTDWSRLSNSAAATVFVKNYKTKSVHVAMFWSKLLSKTFINKSSSLCELGAACLALTSLRGILQGRCIYLAIDNQATVRILENRSVVMGDCADGVQHRLLLSIDGYQFKPVYTNTKAQLSDYLSRNPATVDPDAANVDKFTSPSVSDVGDEDLLVYGPETKTEDYLAKYEIRQDKVRAMAGMC